MDENQPKRAPQFFSRLFLFGAVLALVSLLAIFPAAAKPALLIGILAAIAGLVGWTLSRPE